VVGFAISGGGVGWAWADTEVYYDDQPLPGRVEKLAVSPGGLVGMSTGYLSLLRQFCVMVAGLERADFSAAVARLPTELRRARSEWREELVSVDVEYEPKTKFALIGADSAGRIRGAVFTEAREFEPVEREAWSSPFVDRPASNGAGVLALAQTQLAFVQAKAPRATGGRLTVAKIGPAGVARTSVPLLLAAERAAVDSGRRELRSPGR